MPSVTQLSHEVFEEAKRLVAVFCEVTGKTPSQEDINSRLKMDWKKPRIPSVVLKLCVYWDGQRIGTVQALKTYGQPDRIDAIPNGWGN